MEDPAAQGLLISAPARPAGPGGVQVDLAGPDDDAELRRLLRDNPLGTSIRLSLECEPSFEQASRVQGDRHDTVVARDRRSGRIVAMGSRAVRDVYVNGRRARMGYLGQLRVDPSHRRRRDLLLAGYALTRSRRQEDELPFDLTSIMADGRSARRLLSAGVRGLPRYRPLEPFVTMAIPVRGRRGRRRGRSIEIERGSRSALTDIVDCLQRNARRFQLAPRWSAQDLQSTSRTRGLELADFYLARRRGRVIGCLTRWDQRSFRQVMVRGYAPRLGRWRPAVNAIAPWLGMPGLPAVGHQVAFAFLSHVAVDDDDPLVLGPLIDAVRRDARGSSLSSLVIGCCERNPLIAAVRGRLPHRGWMSMLYTVDWDDCENAALTLDGRVPHPEVALL
jgi:hypothetical protein